MIGLTAPWGQKGAGSLLGVLLASLSLVVSGISAADTGDYFFDVWQGQEGLEMNAVTDIVQSRDGYLWLSTYHGLLRFDGVRFRRFDSANSPALEDNRLTSLFLDDQDVLWIGHETGALTRFRAGVFEALKLGTNWPGGPVESINMDSNRDVWLANNRALLFRLRDGHLLNNLPARAEGDWSPVWLARQQDGILWVVSLGIAGRVRGDCFEPFQFDAAPGSSSSCERVLASSAGGFWVLYNGRVRKWQHDRWTADLGAIPWRNDFATDLLEIGPDSLLAGTMRNGLYLFSAGAQPLHFTRAEGLLSDRVRCLAKDHEANIWLGTGAGGLQALRSRQARILRPPDEWQGHSVLSYIVRPDGSAWIGTEGAGLYRYHDGSWTRFTDEQGLTSLFVWSVFETSQQQLFVGTWGGGLLRQNGDRFEATEELSKFTAPTLALYESRQGELWIGTTIGLCRYDAGKVTCVVGKEKLERPDVRTIAETPDGSLWFGMSGGGLGRLKNGNVTQFRKTDGVGSDFVFSLCTCPDGALWIGTSDNALTRWKHGKFANVSQSCGLPSPSIHQIVDDGAGNLWLGSQRGILRVSKADLNACADGLHKSLRCLTYGSTEGLGAEACPGGFQPGACKAADGRLWFPTSRGLAIIDPAKVVSNAKPPPVIVEELLVEGQSQDLRSAKPLNIEPGAQRYEFHYTGLSFAAPDRVRFKYKLEGLEKEWVEAGPRRIAQYSHLPPGAYRFAVQACNNDDIWNEAGATLGFTIQPFFWQTGVFQGGALLAGAGGVGAGARWLTRRRLRRKLEEAERQHAIERERSRIARDIHDDLGASLTRITMLSQTVRGEFSDESPGASAADQVNRTARELTRAMDEIVWAVNPRHDTLDSLVNYVGEFSQEFLNAAGIRCRLDLPLTLPALALSAETRHNLFLALKEVLHNIVKHSGASEARLSLELGRDQFSLVIADNGRGFDAARVAEPARIGASTGRLAAGNGLRNLRKRLEEVGGHCQWTTAPGQGTCVRLMVTIKP